jgi:gas vesicle protein
MNSFFKGILLGVGIGLLVAPMRGEDMRRLLRERFDEIRANLPENEQLNQYTQQVTNRVSQTGSALRDYAQQAATKVQSTASDLTGLAQQAGTQVKQTGQDVADTTKQAATSAKQNAQSSGTSQGTNG